MRHRLFPSFGRRRGGGGRRLAAGRARRGPEFRPHRVGGSGRSGRLGLPHDHAARTARGVGGSGVPERGRGGAPRAGGRQPQRGVAEPGCPSHRVDRERRPGRGGRARLLQQLLARPGDEHGRHTAHVPHRRPTERAAARDDGGRRGAHRRPPRLPGGAPGGLLRRPDALRPLHPRGSTPVRRSRPAATTRSCRCSRRRTMSRSLRRWFTHGAGRAARRSSHAAGPHAAMVGRLARPLGGRHAAHRDHQLQR